MIKILSPEQPFDRDSACYGSTGYVLPFRITINRPLFAISSFGLEVPWGDETVQFLDDPLQLDGSEVYRFWARRPIEFPRDQVINHFADVRRIFRPGFSITGPFGPGAWPRFPRSTSTARGFGQG